jgi:Zn2+/Cd2+-exporting ATPase
VIVREEDIIPIDGHILKGASTVNQSSITGESVPIEKNVGNIVYAGTTNLTHLMEIKCDKLSTDTTFAKDMLLVAE